MIPIQLAGGDSRCVGGNDLVHRRWYGRGLHMWRAASSEAPIGFVFLLPGAAVDESWRVVGLAWLARVARPQTNSRRINDLVSCMSPVRGRGPFAGPSRAEFRLQSASCQDFLVPTVFLKTQYLTVAMSMSHRRTGGGCSRRALKDRHYYSGFGRPGSRHLHSRRSSREHGLRPALHGRYHRRGLRPALHRR